MRNMKTRGVLEILVAVAAAIGLGATFTGAPCPKCTLRKKKSLCMPVALERSTARTP